jgi:mandelamide amidase
MPFEPLKTTESGERHPGTRRIFREQLSERAHWMSKRGSSLPADPTGVPMTRRTALGIAASIVPASIAARIEALATSVVTAARQGDTEWLELSARDVVRRIRTGDLSAEAYVTRLLQQYETVKALNLVNTIDNERVREAARAVDRARARGRPLGAVAGLPFGVKDQLCVAGYRTTAGNAALRRHVPTRNATVVDALVRAGAIPFCMTAVPDMTVSDGIMHQVSSYSEGFGAVHNPYDPDRIPGGSSGGSAGVLAARIVPAALGLDTNGSIRCPAAFSGVAGLRPSTWTIENALRGARRKRYSDDGVLLPPVGRLDTIGPMARSVADVAFLDTLITGEPVPSVDLRSVRIGIPRADYWLEEPVDPGVAAVIQESFAKLRDAGCQLVEIDFSSDVRSLVGTIDNPSQTSVLAAVGMNASLQSSETMAVWLRANAPDITVEQMYHGRPIRNRTPTLPPEATQVAVLAETSQRYAELYKSRGLSAIAYPTIPLVAPRIRSEGPLEPFGERITVNGVRTDEGRVIARNLFIAPRLGVAALSLPAGLSNGLPVGLQLDALPGHDSELLALGVAVEKVLGRIPAPRVPPG